jgi:hypothetical protein
MQRTTLPARLLTFLAPLPAIHPPPPATYYVDAAIGDDGATGRSPDSAWRTLDRVNATMFTPGDRLLFRAGASWHGQLWPKGPGTPGIGFGDARVRYNVIASNTRYEIFRGAITGPYGTERTGPRLDRALALTPAANSPAVNAGTPVPDNGNTGNAGHRVHTGPPGTGALQRRL